MKRPSGQLVEADVGDLCDSAECGPMSAFDRGEGLVVSDALGARPVVIGRRRRLTRCGETALPGVTRRGDAASGVVGSDPDQVLQPLLDREQLSQPPVGWFVDLKSSITGSHELSGWSIACRVPDIGEARSEQDCAMVTKLAGTNVSPHPRPN
jgi:hypothetical protein